MTVAVLPAQMRERLEGRLPEWLDTRWWDSVETLHAAAPEAEIGWFDLHEKPPVMRAIELARGMRWLNTAYAGVDWLPLGDFQERGIRLTCGVGLTANQVAEYAVLGMLCVAKGYRDVVRAQDRREWLGIPPGIRDLAGSRALILGYGAIGQAIGRMLEGFGAEVVPVRRRAKEGCLGPEEWRPQLGSFDWIVLALPGTAETRGIVGSAELAAMRRDAVLVNFARADCVDQAELTAALREGRIAAAVLDLTAPEPLPLDHELWRLENAHITMHLSGIPTPASLDRAAERFVRNCENYRAGRELEAQVDLRLGY